MGEEYTTATIAYTLYSPELDVVANLDDMVSLFKDACGFLADYKSMYYKLMRAQSKAIEILQNAHINTEQMFVGSKDPVQFPAEKQTDSNSNEPD